MVVIVLTKEQVEESHRKIDEWWDSLGYDVKGKLRDMVWAVQHPMRKDLKMDYAKAKGEVAVKTIVSDSEGQVVFWDNKWYREIKK